MTTERTLSYATVLPNNVTDAYDMLLWLEDTFDTSAPHTDPGSAYDEALDN
jgi:hypothetical protein